MSCECENDNEPKDVAPDILFGRRGFMTKITVAVGALVGTVMAIPFVSAMVDPVIRKKGTTWREIGQLSEFNVGETRIVSFRNASPYKWESKISYSAAYVRREENDKLTAFSVNCAHLGCPVRWVPKSELFLCPCHGGVYYKDGSRASGPPPRGLYTYPVRIQNNKVEIETEALPITNIS